MTNKETGLGLDDDSAAGSKPESLPPEVADSLRSGLNQMLDWVQKIQAELSDLTSGAKPSMPGEEVVAEIIALHDRAHDLSIVLEPNDNREGQPNQDRKPTNSSHSHRIMSNLSNITVSTGILATPRYWDLMSREDIEKQIESAIKAIREIQEILDGTGNHSEKS